MDLSLREWLLIIGAVLILGVLIDGYRRARNNKKGSLKLAIDKNLSFKDDDRVDYFNGELPNGSARTVLRADEEAPSASSAVDHDLTPEPLFVDESSDPVETTTEAAELEENDPLFEESLGEHGIDEQRDRVTADQQHKQSVPESSSTEKVVEEVIVINAFAPEQAPFNGTELMEVILACGMRYGDLKIFHRHEKTDGESAVQFSMANALKPGFFDLEDIDNFSTPGVSFFMSMPGPTKSMKAFDYMLETAQCVVKNLGGDLRDEQHSTLTSQTIEHARQKIRDYERRQLSLLQ